MRLIGAWSDEAAQLLFQYSPEKVASETIPAVGGGNFVVATQSYLAHAQITTVHAVALINGYDNITQIGATTVKARIGLRKDATKVQVRNGVFDLVPALVERKKDWTKLFDEPDACAVALTALGYDRRQNGS
jgi:Holliday junction resolvasome RuvABC endonuclease subunit